MPKMFLIEYFVHVLETIFAMTTNSDSINIEQEWRDAVVSRNPKEIRRLFKEHHRTIDFRKVLFDDGDNTLHKVVRQNSTKWIKFLLLIKTNVRANSHCI